MVSSIAEAPTIPLSIPTIVNITNETEVNLAQQGNATSLPPIVSMGKFQKEKIRCWLFNTMYFKKKGEMEYGETPPYGHLSNTVTLLLQPLFLAVWQEPPYISL